MLSQLQQLLHRLEIYREYWLVFIPGPRSLTCLNVIKRTTSSRKFMPSLLQNHKLFIITGSRNTHLACPYQCTSIMYHGWWPVRFQRKERDRWLAQLSWKQHVHCIWRILADVGTHQAVLWPCSREMSYRCHAQISPRCSWMLDDPPWMDISEGDESLKRVS